MTVTQIVVLLAVSWAAGVVIGWCLRVIFGARGGRSDAAPVVAPSGAQEQAVVQGVATGDTVFSHERQRKRDEALARWRGDVHGGGR